MRNQPSTIGVAVPTARVSKKSEVFPGKIVCAIVEKRNADNPKPEMTIPVTVVLYVVHKNGQRLWFRIVTDDFVWEALRDGVQRGGITCIAADPREQPKQDEYKQCSACNRFRVMFRRIIHPLYPKVSSQKEYK